MTIAVMVVEDDPMVREIICEYTASVDGFAVAAQAGKTTEAFASLATAPVDLIILDIHMPGKNGVEFLAELRAAGDRTDVIFLTASNDTRMIGEALKLGAVDYLIKPFGRDRFDLALVKYRRRHQILHQEGETTQEELDGLLGQVRGEGAPPAKGLHPKTLENVRACIGRIPAATFTQQEVAQALGLSKVTVRKYLEHLIAAGEVAMEMEYGGIGRPTHVYRRR